MGSARPFEGQTVVVTGASRGLGRGCALEFAAQGAEVILIARKRDELEALETEIQASGGKAKAMPCDVTEPDAIALAFASLDRCDVLLNNAGGNRPQPFLEVDLETFDALIALNVRSMFLTAQAAVRLMAKQRSGAIVHMSSQMGHVGAADRTVYCLTKHAIEGLTKAMAVELAPLGIRVNAVAPTYIETSLTKPFLANDAFRREVVRRIPLGRVGTVDEVVGAVLFLASSAASLITGTSLLIDGGYTAQ